MDSRTSLLAPPLGEGALSSLSLGLTAPACTADKKQGSETSAHHRVRAFPQGPSGIFSFSPLPWLYHLSSNAGSHLSLLFPRLLLWAEGAALPQGSSQAKAFRDSPLCDSERAPRGLLSDASQQTLWHIVEKAMATHLCPLSQGQNCQLNSGTLLTNQKTSTKTSIRDSCTSNLRQEREGKDNRGCS